MWNISDKSAAFCERVIKAGLHADIFRYLKSDVLSPANLTAGQMEAVKKIFVQGQLGTLHNVVQKAKAAREHFRECGAVDILQPFREGTTQNLQVHLSETNLQHYFTSPKRSCVIGALCLSVYLSDCLSV